MKKLPPKFVLNVFGSRVPVKIVKDLTLNSGALGYYFKKEIAIDAGQSSDDMCKTLIHECTHALFDRVGLNQAISREVEEIVAENFANLIFENFKVELK